MFRVEIRCCCEPGKLLGTIEATYRGGVAHLIARLGPDDETPRCAMLEWGVFRDSSGHEYRALKADRNQLPFLRKLSTFKEDGRDSR